MYLNIAIDTAAIGHEEEREQPKELVHLLRSITEGNLNDKMFETGYCRLNQNLHITFPVPWDRV
jgi:hypothetical protein